MKKLFTVSVKVLMSNQSSTPYPFYPNDDKYRDFLSQIFTDIIKINI